MLDRFKVVNLSPPQIIMLVYIVIILIGTLLLKLPFATIHGLSFLNALFTSTSAMTVTGLSVVSIPGTFTLFGQIIILLLIQMGGLGIMTFAIFFFILLGRKIGLKQRILMQQSMNQTEIGGIIYLAKRLLIYSIVIELIGTLFLTLRWGPEVGWLKGFYIALFHSVSAFNNAGFSTWTGGLNRFANDPTVNIVITFLFMIGGIGFTVLIDAWSKKRFKRLSLQSKIMIVGTVIINLLSIIAVFILEYSNPHTLGPLPFHDKIWVSYFQGTMPRTAGFSTIDISSLHHPTVLLMCLLMFIGAGSGSTGGGIKLTTFVTMLLCVVYFLRGKADVVIFKRTIPQSTIIRALAITFLSCGVIFIAMLILDVTEKAPFLEIMFETVSAFSTTGASLGLTPHLSLLGRIIIILVMLIGKLGPLTFAFSFSQQQTTLIRHPKENILTG